MFLFRNSNIAPFGEGEIKFIHFVRIFSWNTPTHISRLSISDGSETIALQYYVIGLLKYGVEEISLRIDGLNASCMISFILLQCVKNLATAVLTTWAKKVANMSLCVTPVHRYRG